ncbi:MAG TPA: hypothetical protein VG651_18440 [Stellaceae bacterium]|nr:hypothetical protein [Stellaceae bacterium]
MDYDPADHMLTGRCVAGAWVACLAVLAAVFIGPPAVHHTTAVVAQARAAVVAHARAVVKGPQLCRRHTWSGFRRMG